MDLGNVTAAATSNGDVAVSGFEQVDALLAEVQRLHEGLDDRQRIDAISKLEDLKNAAAAAQAVITTDFEASQLSEQRRAGEPKERLGRGIASQVALARRESPHRGRQHLNLAHTLHLDLLNTLQAFRAGRISEWKAKLMVRETAYLCRDHRLKIDEAIARDPDRIAAMGDGELVAEVKKLAYELDAQAFVERRKKAESERRTSVRPAPDVMAFFTALLGVKEACAVQGALHREAVRLNMEGDPRSRGQIMADLLVQRVVSPQLADGASGIQTQLMVHLVVRDDVLLGDSDAGGYVEGYGEVPGDLLRQWIADNLEAGVEVFIRRLYENPRTGELVAMDSKAQLFDGRLAEYLRLRDQRCRTPYCDAPVKHLDHVVKRAHGGPTTASNAQGLCERCNYDKEAVGWSARPRPGPRHTVETVTPTGHVYTSTTSRVAPERRPSVDFYFPVTIAA